MSQNYNNFRKFISSLIWIFSIFFGVNAYSQIFPAQGPANNAPGNPDAIVGITAIQNGNIFEVNGVEACVQQNGTFGDNPDLQIQRVLVRQ